MRGSISLSFPILDAATEFQVGVFAGRVQTVMDTILLGLSGFGHAVQHFSQAFQDTDSRNDSDASPSSTPIPGASADSQRHRIMMQMPHGLRSIWGTIQAFLSVFNLESDAFENIVVDTRVDLRANEAEDSHLTESQRTLHLDIFLGKAFDLDEESFLGRLLELVVEGLLGELSLLWEANIGSKTAAAGHPASQAPGGGHNGAEAKGGTTEDEHSSSTLIDNIGLSLEVHLNAYAGAVEIFDNVSNEFTQQCESQ